MTEGDSAVWDSVGKNVPSAISKGVSMGHMAQWGE